MEKPGRFKRKAGAIVTAYQWKPADGSSDTLAGIQTSAGVFKVRPGDWIVEDGSGRQWVVEREVFEALYEAEGGGE